MPPKKSTISTGKGKGKGKGKGAGVPTITIPSSLFKTSSTKEGKPKIVKEKLVLADFPDVSDGDKWRPKTRVQLLVNKAEALKMKEQKPQLTTKKTPRPSSKCLKTLQDAIWLKPHIKGVIYYFSTKDQDFADSHIVPKINIKNIDNQRLKFSDKSGSTQLWRKGNTKFLNLLCDYFARSNASTKIVLDFKGRSVNIKLAFGSQNDPSTFRLAKSSIIQKMINKFQPESRKIISKLAKSPLVYPFLENANTNVRHLIDSIDGDDIDANNLIVQASKAHTFNKYVSIVYNTLKSHLDVSKEQFTLNFFRDLTVRKNNMYNVALKKITSVDQAHLMTLLYSSTDLQKYDGLYETLMKSSVKPTTVGEYIDRISRVLVLLSQKTTAFLTNEKKVTLILKSTQTVIFDLAYMSDGVLVTVKPDDILRTNEILFTLFKNNGINIFRERVEAGLYRPLKVFTLPQIDKMEEIKDCPMNEQLEFLVEYKRFLSYKRDELYMSLKNLINPSLQFVYIPTPISHVNIRTCIDKKQKEQMNICGVNNITSDTLVHKINGKLECLSISDILRNKSQFPEDVIKLTSVYRRPPKINTIALKSLPNTLKTVDVEAERLYKEKVKNETDLYLTKQAENRKKYFDNKALQKQSRKLAEVAEASRVKELRQIKTSQTVQHRDMDSAFRNQNQFIFTQFAKHIVANPVYIGYDVTKHM
jgi:hypothetical protein